LRNRHIGNTCVKLDVNERIKPEKVGLYRPITGNREMGRRFIFARINIL
jgi:hypothetical protein